MTEAQAIAEFKVDRTGWPKGEWDDEPDRIEWREQGAPCLMVRNRMGIWCGYVGVTKDHKWFGQGYSVPYDAPEDVDRSIENVEVHGGLTYADKCQGHICHVPQEGEDGDVWWLGFDCGHAGDMFPSFNRSVFREFSDGLSGLTMAEGYKNVAYVKTEIKRLVEQVLATK